MGAKARRIAANIASYAATHPTLKLARFPTAQGLFIAFTNFVLLISP